jgi:hypothetical protein
LINDTASAPASSAALAVAVMAVTLGLSHDQRQRSYFAHTLDDLKSQARIAAEEHPAVLPFGHEILASRAAIPAASWPFRYRGIVCKRLAKNSL